MHLVCRTLLGLLLFMIVGDLLAQGPVLHQFTSNDGLPGNTVYFSMQDSKGFIWSGTDRGLTRFDGNSFKLYTIEDGLPSNEVWKISEDYRGRLWFSTFGGLCYYENGVIKKLKVDHLSKELGKVEHFCTSLGHFLIIHIEYSQLFVLNEEDRLLPFRTKDRFYISEGFILYENDYTAFLFEPIRKRLDIPPGDSLIACGSTILLNRNNKIASKITTLKTLDLKSYIPISEQKILFLIKDGLWLADYDTIRKIELEKYLGSTSKIKVKRIKKIDDNRYWIKTSDNNYVLDSLWHPILNYDFLDQLSINNVFADQQENLWFSTSNGLFFLNQKAQNSRTYTTGWQRQPESYRFPGRESKTGSLGNGKEWASIQIYL